MKFAKLSCLSLIVYPSSIKNKTSADFRSGSDPPSLAPILHGQPRVKYVAQVYKFRMSEGSMNNGKCNQTSLIYNYKWQSPMEQKHIWEDKKNVMKFLLILVWNLTKKFILIIFNIYKVSIAIVSGQYTRRVRRLSSPLQQYLATSDAATVSEVLWLTSIVNFSCKFRPKPKR